MSEAVWFMTSMPYKARDMTILSVTIFFACLMTMSVIEFWSVICVYMLEFLSLLYVYYL